nr:MAG TPA: PucR C-terminal helix-turn-helix domain [Caudoviricetes sp.]
MDKPIRLPKLLRDVVIDYADNDMNRAAVAKKYGVSSAAVHYRLNQVQEMTGLDPRKFYDLVELLKEW